MIVCLTVLVLQTPLGYHRRRHLFPPSIGNGFYKNEHVLTCFVSVAGRHSPCVGVSVRQAQVLLCSHSADMQWLCYMIVVFAVNYVIHIGEG
jgi:hypothetical protein